MQAARPGEDWLDAEPEPLMRALLRALALLLLAVSLGGCGTVGRVGVMTNEDAYIQDRKPDRALP